MFGSTPASPDDSVCGWLRPLGPILAMPRHTDAPASTSTLLDCPVSVLSHVAHQLCGNAHSLAALRSTCSVFRSAVNGLITSLSFDTIDLVDAAGENRTLQATRMGLVSKLSCRDLSSILAGWSWIGTYSSVVLALLLCCSLLIAANVLLACLRTDCAP